MTDSAEKTPLLTRLVEVFLRGDVAILLVVASVVVGLVALWATPREEEPQIVVPMADVFVSVGGLSSQEVEQKITARLEKLLYQIDGVEYVYSMSRPGACIVTVRFYVGEDRNNSLVKLYNKIHSNVDQIPPEVTGWVVKPVEVDDVPIVNVTLWSDRPAAYGDHELRRLADALFQGVAGNGLAEHHGIALNHATALRALGWQLLDGELVDGPAGVAADAA